MAIWDSSDLNVEQETAILTEGSVFLVACPGSGKTRTLTYKIAHELTKLKSKRQFVVAITYTNRAAEEIHERIERMGLTTSQLWIGTIHSFCLEWILKPYAIYHDQLAKGFRVISPHDAEKILTELCRPYERPKLTYWDCTFYFTGDDYVITCPNETKRRHIREVLAAYFQILADNRQIDFELILRCAYQLISNHPSIGVLLSRLFSFILVDEYQDTKAIQYFIIAAILRAGAGNTGTFIVGDPNQAIYQSLGGFPIGIAEFKAMAAIELTQLDLVKNYRSSERIVSYFCNYSAFATSIEAASAGKCYPSLISFDNSVIRTDLENEVIRLIRFNIENLGIAPHEICILAPQWVHLSSMTRRLMSRLPQYNFNGPGMIPFARDIENFWYKLARIILTTASPSMYVRRLRWAGEILSDFEHSGIHVPNLSSKSLLRDCNSLEITETNGLLYLREFFDALFVRLGIDFRITPLLLEHHSAFFESSQSRIDRLRQDGGEFVTEIGAFRRVFENPTGITISTIHGIKGDEFDAVIAYGLLEGMVPHFNDDDAQSSAMKLLYVICSRARKNLHLISERERSRGIRGMYEPTLILEACSFDYDLVPEA